MILFQNRKLIRVNEYIIYYVVCAHEVLHQVKVTTEYCVLLKFDFEKAFDRVGQTLRALNSKRKRVWRKMDRVDQIFLGFKLENFVLFKGELGQYFQSQREGAHNLVQHIKFHF